MNQRPVRMATTNYVLVALKLQIEGTINYTYRFLIFFLQIVLKGAVLSSRSKLERQRELILIPVRRACEKGDKGGIVDLRGMHDKVY
jgi:hypothetical protein